MTAYRIRNWKKFQHYSTRNPPWVKLYGRELAHDSEWMAMSFAQKGLLTMLWVLASEKEDGHIPSPRQLKARIESETDTEQPMPSYEGLMGRWIEEVPSEGVEEPVQAPPPPPAAPVESSRPGVPPCPECGGPLKRQQSKHTAAGAVLPPAWWCPTHKGDFSLDDPRIFSHLTFASQETVRLEVKAYKDSIPEKAPKPAAQKRKTAPAWDRGLEHSDAPPEWNPPRSPKGSPAALALNDLLVAVSTEGSIDTKAFETWYSVLIPVSLTEDNTLLTIAWPARVGQEWFKSGYLPLCQRLAERLGRRVALWSPST